jgi:hypothetical protein
MKTKALLIVALFFLFPVFIHAQEDGILDAFKKSAAKYGNNQDGNRDNNNGDAENNGEEPQNNPSSDGGDNTSPEGGDNPSPDNSDNPTPNENDAGMDFFVGKFENCMYATVNYLDILNKLEKDAERDNSCESYELLITAITGSTTIMYCPEYIYNLSNNDLSDFFDALYDKKNNSGNLPASASKFFQKLLKVISWDGDGDPPPSEIIREKLTKKFRPDYVIFKSIEIQQMMEGLGCSK